MRNSLHDFFTKRIQSKKGGEIIFNAGINSANRPKKIDQLLKVMKPQIDFKKNENQHKKFFWWT